MNSNIGEFLKTRKLWSPIITLMMTIIVWALPQVLPSLEITPDIVTAITLFLWGIASIVVFGDIRYDWINAGNSEP